MCVIVCLVPRGCLPNLFFFVVSTIKNVKKKKPSTPSAEKEGQGVVWEDRHGKWKTGAALEPVLRGTFLKKVLKTRRSVLV